jgi:flagellar biosynthesis protein FliQ
VARFLPFLISLVLTVYALFSCIQTRDKDVPYLPKLVWILLIVFVPFAGPIVWLLMVRYYASEQEVTEPGRAAKRPSPRPLAPDDDPDFLASLEPFRDPRLSNNPATDDKPEHPETPTAQSKPTPEPDPTPDPAEPADSDTPVDDAKPDDGPRA